MKLQLTQQALGWAITLPAVAIFVYIVRKSLKSLWEDVVEERGKFAGAFLVFLAAFGICMIFGTPVGITSAIIGGVYVVVTGCMLYAAAEGTL